MAKPQRLLVFGFNSQVSHLVVPQLAELEGVERVWWIGDVQGRDDLPNYPRVTPLDMQSAYQAALPELAGVERGAYPPLLTDDLLQLYQAIFPTFLMMMDRVELHGPGVSYHRRKNRFHQLFFYWLNFLHRERITHFIAGAVPHEMTDYLLAELCHQQGIGVTLLMQHGVDATVALTHYRDLGTPRMKRLARVSAEEQAALRREYADRHQRRTDNVTGEPAELFYMKNNFWDKVDRSKWERVKRRLKGRLQTGGAGALTASSLRYAAYLAIDKPYLVKRRDAAMWRDYAARTVGAPDLTQPYVYLALHMQPEATTVPLGERFADQYLLAEVLLQAFPADVQVYVKEHPNQKARGRDEQYYDRWPPSPRFHFLASNVPTFELQRNCLAVATVTGTVGIEAVYFGKPVLLFGHAYYKPAPGVFVTTTVAQARAAAASILAGEVEITEDQRLAFVSWLAERSLAANVDDMRAAYSRMGLSAAANATRLVNEIAVRLAGPPP